MQQELECSNEIIPIFEKIMKKIATTIATNGNRPTQNCNTHQKSLWKPESILQIQENGMKKRNQSKCKELLTLDEKFRLKEETQNNCNNCNRNFSVIMKSSLFLRKSTKKLQQHLRQMATHPYKIATHTRKAYENLKVFCKYKRTVWKSVINQSVRNCWHWTKIRNSK